MTIVFHRKIAIINSIIYVYKEGLVMLFFSVLLATCISIYSHSNSVASSEQADSLLAIVLMVKNEETVMVRTLEPFVTAGIQHYLIFDTGSTDNTRDITLNYFKEHHILNGHIFYELFVDFATSRNRALELAEQQFPQVPFFLMVDAEWYMKGTEHLLAFCKEHAHIPISDPAYSHSYCIDIIHTGTNNYYRSDRLLRNSCKLRYKRPVHEKISQPTNKLVPSTVYFEQSPEKLGDERSARRWQRDKEILLKEYMRDPKDPDTLFDLARTYEGLKDYQNAHKYYKERTKLSGGKEQNFLALYGLARITELLSMRTRSISWLEALNYYMQAYSMRPIRAEPLVRIAQHYLQTGEIALAYIFAQRAVALPFPTNEMLWIEKNLYDFARYDILSQCAWVLKEYEVGEQALRKALEIHPNNPHLCSNLAFYQERKKV
jgi:tetratricopeptide (TPR) repeat protein